MAQDLASRFWNKVDKTDGCWLWTGRPLADGYGQFGGRRAHRVAWELTYGPVQRGLCVLHHCDTPLCVRPSHLFDGTKRENSRDMARKGRQWKQKITPSTAAQIRAAYERGVTRQVDLAARFGVDQTTISRVVLRRGVV